MTAAVEPGPGRMTGVTGPGPGTPTADPGDDPVGEILAAAVRDGVIPGAVFAAGAPGLAARVVVAGDAQVAGGSRRPMCRDTPFDLASLTKVVATLPAVLRLAALGGLELDDTVTRFLPGLRGEGRDTVTVRQLLAHTSGLSASVPFWSRYDDPDEARAALLRVPLRHRPGSRVVYSDVGFLLLGLLIPAVTGTGLDASVAGLVTGPLGMNRTCFRPAAASAPAATELQPDGSALTGVVHDENARFFGGIAGHAGLFAPVDDLIRYLERGWLSDGFLPAAARRDACRAQTAGLGGARGLGWVLRGDPADMLGPCWPAGSVSHTGFTGTSLACDPASGGWAVLLTNEVHLGRGRGLIRGLREAVHDHCAPGPR